MARVHCVLLLSLALYAAAVCGDENFTAPIPAPPTLPDVNATSTANDTTGPPTQPAPMRPPYIPLGVDTEPAAPAQRQAAAQVQPLPPPPQPAAPLTPDQLKVLFGRVTDAVKEASQEQSQSESSLSDETEL